MCGIVGIIGHEPVAPLLVDALKRLEYRGYDSAGIATLEHGVLARRRAEGKLKNLEAKLAREPLEGTIGIGHTRWATHGRPTENNAHPARHRPRSRWCTTASSRTSPSCAANSKPTASSSRPRPIPKSSPISSARRSSAG